MFFIDPSMVSLNFVFIMTLFTKNAKESPHPFRGGMNFAYFTKITFLKIFSILGKVFVQIFVNNICNEQD